jgi:Zn-dependent protease/CBS domain-containing protein
MFTARIRLIRLFGIPISVDLSWLIILALISWTLAEAIFKPELPDASEGERVLLGFVTAIAFFLCIVLHEMGHALVARSRGIPIRGITLFLFGGVAELAAEPPSASSEFLMAIAGPLVSVLLSGVFFVLYLLATALSWSTSIELVFFSLAWINLSVLVLNLLPAFPLDGGRVFRSILWGVSGNLRRATYWAAAIGQGFAWLLIAVGVVRFFQHDYVGGIWLGLIGMFLNNAARASYQQVVLQQALKGEPVSRFMNLQPIVVPPSLDLRSWVEDYVYRYHRKTFPVASNGHLEGYISTQALARFPRAEWDRHTVAEVMRQDLQAVTVSPQTDALEALGRMQRTGASRLLVSNGTQLLGIVSLKDLLRFLNLKIELESIGDASPARHS